MSTRTSPDAARAREDARQGDGRFGHQHHSSPGTDVLGSGGPGDRRRRAAGLAAAAWPQAAVRDLGQAKRYATGDDLLGPGLPVGGSTVVAVDRGPWRDAPGGAVSQQQVVAYLADDTRARVLVNASSTGGVWATPRPDGTDDDRALAGAVNARIFLDGSRDRDLVVATQVADLDAGVLAPGDDLVAAKATWLAAACRAADGAGADDPLVQAEFEHQARDYLANLDLADRRATARGSLGYAVQRMLAPAPRRMSRLHGDWATARGARARGDVDAAEAVERGMFRWDGQR